jgi:hypothetical protein
MTYRPRIPAEDTYVASVGRAFYNFTYLEWVAVWTIVKLSADGFGSVPRGKSSSFIAKALVNAIDTTQPPLSFQLRRRLLAFHSAYRASISARNKLLHAHPYTTPDGLQRLQGGGHDWPTDAVIDAARQFEQAAVDGSDVFHGDLARERQ